MGFKKICDRCDREIPIGKGKKVQILRLKKTKSGEEPDEAERDYDICISCSDDFEKWMGMKS